MRLLAKLKQLNLNLRRFCTYETPPHQWNKSYPIADGKRQSPINLSLNDPDISFKKSYDSKLQLNYKNDDIICVVNNGSSITFFSNEQAVITGGPLGTNSFKLLQFHFHWGSESHCGSEHLLNGRQFSAELHIVHMNEMYDSFDEALTKDDGLCVIGAFIDAKVGPDNKAYAPVIKEFENVKSKGCEMKISPNINCCDLLPDNLHNYAFYEGSLTTPPLNECVHWICMLDPVVISEEQMEKFRQLEGSNNNKIVNNYRNIQSLFGRKIFHVCCN